MRDLKLYEIVPDGFETEVKKNQDAASEQVRRAEQNVAEVKGKFNIRVALDLDDKKYQSIVFGEKKNTLILMPKANSSRRFVVAFDPKSNLPQNILLEQAKDGKWMQVRSLKVSFGEGK